MEDIKGLNEEIDDDFLTLVSQDGQTFQVARKIAKMSELVKTMVEGDTEETEIPLHNVQGSVLEKVIEFLTYHYGNPTTQIERPLKSNNMENIVGKWDANFCNVDQSLIFELILAANYMDIKSLLDLTCAKIATMMKGKNAEEIRKDFNIINDFTQEEEAIVKAENRWAEEI